MSTRKVTVDLDLIEIKTIEALVAHGAERWIAEAVADAVRVAEATGNLICGLYYLESYCQQLVTGRVVGDAEPQISQPKSASIRVDARFGFAQPAFARGIVPATQSARDNGTCALAICHSHTCTSMGYFTAQIAREGLIGIGMTNAPACVSPPNGTEAVLGTNPIAMSVPAQGGQGVAFQFDQSTSAIAVGKIRVAAAANEKIPLGWAVDKQGHPTDDPHKALQGSLVSAGGYKGFGFGLMAEVLAAAVTGSLNSVDAPPLKTPEGTAHDLGQFYFLLDPQTFAGDAFWQRLATLQDAVAKQPEARLPGSQRSVVSRVDIDAELWDKVLSLATQ